MTDIYELILAEFREAKACHVDRFPPYYIASIGCHLLNLHNRKQKVYFEARRIPDLRSHIMFIAPPGGEKTFWQEQFVRGHQAILEDSKIDHAMKGMMTEAGFVGTIRLEAGQKVEVPGICKRHQFSITAIEEFSAISEMLRQEHSKALDPALLGALDSGWVYKDLAAGPLAYRTYLTLWVGTQPARFDLRGGMARRFLFIYFVPTPTDMKEIKLARRASKNIKFNPTRTDRIRAELKNLQEKIKGIEKIESNPEIYALYDQLKLPYWEEMLYDRLIMGYKVMKGDFDSMLYVSVDDATKRMLLDEARYRDMIRRGSEFAEILSIMRAHGGAMGKFALKDELLLFGKDWRQSQQLISEMSRMGALKRLPDGSLILSEELRGKKK